MSNMSVTFSGIENGKKYRDGPFYLSNGPSWGRVCNWIVSAGGPHFPYLRHLANAGRVRDTTKLGIDLAGAVAAAPPSIRGLLESLADRVGVGDEGETCAVGDGDNDEEDEEDDLSEEIKKVFGRCIDTSTHKQVPCPASGADDKPQGDRAEKQSQLAGDVQAMEKTEAGRKTLARGAKIADGVKKAIGTAVASALQALDDESQGGASYFLDSIRRMDAGGAHHGANAVFRSIFTNVYEEIFEFALADHSFSGAHAVGVIGAKIAVKAEEGILKGAAWALGKLRTREALGRLREAGAELTDADRRFIEALARIGEEAIRAVLRGAGVEDVEVDRAALGRRIMASLA